MVSAREGAVMVRWAECVGCVGHHSTGISKNNIMAYEKTLKSDKFLVLPHGTADEITNAKSFLLTTGTAKVRAHQR